MKRVTRELRSLDPRVKIGLALLLALAAWRASPGGLVLYACGLAGLLTLLWDERAPGRRVVRAAIVFVAVWTLAKFLLSLPGGAFLPALAEAGILGLRLFVLVLTGFTLALSCSPHAIGLALSWGLRPVLRDRAWQAALAIGLMVHFMPILVRTWHQARETVSYRVPDLSLSRRFELTAQTAMRSMAVRTWDQTLAVASRGLDGPEAWRGGLAFRSGDAVFGALTALLILGAMLL